MIDNEIIEEVILWLCILCGMEKEEDTTGNPTGGKGDHCL
jgi:hypothetical protein